MLEPNAPLHRYGLMQLPPRSLAEVSHLPPTLLPLTVDPHVYHLLVGHQALDFVLAPYLDLDLDLNLVRTAPDAPGAAPQEHPTLSNTQAVWLDYVLSVVREPHPPLLQLEGPHRVAKHDLALEVARQLERPLYRLKVQTMPTDLELLADVLLHAGRQQRLEPGIWLLDSGPDDPNAASNETLKRLILAALEKLEGIVFYAGRSRLEVERDTLSLELGAPSQDEQQATWTAALSRGKRTKKAQGALELEASVLAEQFDFSFGEIRSLALEAISARPEGDAESLRRAAWDAGRRRSRPALERLAQRIEPAPSSRWERLILPEDQKKTLRAVVDHVRQRGQVYRGWGWSREGERGLGMTALFAGSSGTGKTLAAETVAQALDLDLFRIDLSSMVSKYVGETEKNLAQIFDAAEVGGSVLLFDEADALFGKRGEVKESQDRYANIEVSYLLQRMEAFRGLAILTTNLESSLDDAFLRRLRFVVRFPTPEKLERLRIWENVFPPGTPLHSSVNFERLAQLEVSGGNIRNIALNAAFTASSEPVLNERMVQMRHLLWAAQDEVRKLKRLLRPFEIDGW